MTVCVSSFLTFVFFASQILCNKIIIKKAAAEKNVGSGKVEFRYEIYHDEPTSDHLNSNIYTGTGSACLKKGRSLGISTWRLKDSHLNSNFNFALNSVGYEPYQSYNEEVSSIENDYFCLVWGSWWPKVTSEKNQIEYYFNIITKTEDFTKRYLYVFENTAIGVNLNVNLNLDHILTNFVPKFLPFYAKLTLIKFDCKYNKVPKTQFVVKEVTTTHNSDGKLEMTILADRSDEEELEHFIAYQGIFKKLSEKDSKILKKLRCYNDKLEYSVDSSKNNGSGADILI